MILHLLFYICVTKFFSQNTVFDINLTKNLIFDKRILTYFNKVNVVIFIIKYLS